MSMKIIRVVKKVVEHENQQEWQPRKSTRSPKRLMSMKINKNGNHQNHPGRQKGRRA
jgi:hypothetical protein